MDLDYGAWQMRTHDEVRAEAPDAFSSGRPRRSCVRFPDGESLQDLVARTSDALRTVIARHPTDPVVMVGHDSVNRALLLQLLDQPLAAYWKLAQDPCMPERDRDRGRQGPGPADQRHQSSELRALTPTVGVRVDRRKAQAIP